MTMSGHTIALDEEARISARRIFSIIANELMQVEVEFERQARSNVQVIDYLGEYLRASGGKRVRPALAILSNYAVGGDGSRYNSIRMATVMEFLHTATLVHDDIIDKADTRRKRPTVNALYGNETAVLMGDWLYMSAFETSLAERSLPVLDILTSVTRKMTEGEILQLTLLGDVDVSEAQYFDVLKRKTAYLFSASCEIGAMLGGKVTLPLIYLRNTDPQARELIQTVLREGKYSSVTQQDLLKAMVRAGALQHARARADEYAEEACRALENLPDSEYSESLKALPTYILDRD